VNPGVETEEQLAQLRAEGCDEAQGFHLGRPVLAREVEALLGGASPRKRPVTGA
jgi:EAL domain-containing protein (putative c-di-GMP-specific phosphodiesterase class I)